MKAAAIYIGIAALTFALFFFAPQIDLATSRLFYEPGGFVFAGWPPLLFVSRTVPWITCCWLGLVLAAAAWLFVVGRPLWRLDRKALAFLVVSLAVGPGLLSNALLKDYWGRARPAQIEAFGGPHRFSLAPLPATECERNCAFVSGHAAVGFSLVAFGLLFPPGRLRKNAVVAALGFGGLIGFARIVQGRHFLSDVVYAGLLVFGTTSLLHWWIVQRDGLASRPMLILYSVFFRIVTAAGNTARRAAELPAFRLGFGVTTALILIVISIGAIDRPLAVFFYARDQDLRSLFDFTGRLGLAYGYLTLFGLVFVALHWGGSLPRLRQLAQRMRALSAVPAFLFLSIAASGLIVDILKVVCGRARPKLLVQSDVYGFFWLGWHPDRWSFPSGHSATIVALMTALWYLWPRHFLFYILAAATVAGSRVAVGAHYLGDVLAGALIAYLTTRWIAGLFAKGGLDLTAVHHRLYMPGKALPR